MTFFYNVTSATDCSVLAFKRHQSHFFGAQSLSYKAQSITIKYRICCDLKISPPKSIEVTASSRCGVRDYQNSMDDTAKKAASLLRNFSP